MKHRVANYCKFILFFTVFFGFYQAYKLKKIPLLNKDKKIETLVISKKLKHTHSFEDQNRITQSNNEVE